MPSRDKKQATFPGADERTPSRAQYSSWINNTNEGATEAQTLANLAFFRWLHDEYGMVLDIYAFDAGAIDGAKFYGSTDSERFRRQFPRGFGPLADAAGAMGCRLGLWGGPDGFGETDEAERARIEMMVSLCRDHRFMLFKLDAVCGGLRPEKQRAFVEQMTACRRYCPDLIVLNHRLELGAGLPHTTTFLWGGAETYIDVHMVNRTCAPHNRACALHRGLVPGLQRLTEDHGVCLSSCLDYWEDDLVLQAFNRCLILAPEIYGNPWLLRDDEFPRLARIYNLHRRFGDILVDGMELPETLGPSAVSRGDEATRLVTLRNLTWEPVRYTLNLDESIGLRGGGEVELRRLHPHERILGRFDFGEAVEVEVLPFRACLVMATRRANPEVGVEGCDYDVIRDVPGRPVTIKLLAAAGTTAEVRLAPGERAFAAAAVDGEELPGLADGQAVRVEFPGTPLQQPWHRKLGDLAAIEVPDDAEALYEATCFAADNNALEARELRRSGPSGIPQVQRAREAFFSQPTFRRRLLWDKYLFDDDPETGFAVSRRHRPLRIRGGAFRLDLGASARIDHLQLVVGGDYALQPIKSQEGVWGAVSADLKTWTQVRFFATEDITADLPGEAPIRYVRLDGCPDRITEVRGTYRGKALDRSGWRASNLFGRYRSAPATHAWSLAFTLEEAAPGAYLAIACHGRHGAETVYAACRVADGYAGAPARSPSYPSNTWEGAVRQPDGHYTYYIPVTAEMVGKPIEAVAILLKGGDSDIRVEAWLTAYPIPMAARELVLEP
ncbi:MAG: hypothetical protein AMJ81_12275 [Phycisphaerae bacterium SM23_33]|nr:MAG: hypothetical protein AMJ81_12275 [Phycisphaerae bacterium SM23_33]